jgi:ribosome biogenesis GTPase
MNSGDDVLAGLGWNPGLQAALAGAGEEAVPARVARIDRGALTALGADGELRVITTRNTDALAPGGIAVGDWIAVDLETMLPVAVLPRRSVLVRHATGGATAGQAVAANLDLLAVVLSIDIPLRPRKLERLLAAAWSSGAQPLVLLTKADLCSDPAAEAATATASAPGVQVICTSAVRGDGVSELPRHVAPGQTLGFIGPSGAGKSTLVNHLAGAQLQATAEVRDDGKGRHTTTHRQLIVLDGGGLLIDTPGMREVGLWDAALGIEAAFSDLMALADQCRYSDCSHTNEPGCAVLEAADADPAVAARVEGWRKLADEQQRVDVLRDERAQAEAKQKLRGLQRTMRTRPPKGSL